MHIAQFVAGGPSAERNLHNLSRFAAASYQWRALIERSSLYNGLRARVAQNLADRSRELDRLYSVRRLIKGNLNREGSLCSPLINLH